MTELRAPTVSLEHLVQLSDANGIFEHAKFERPRPECGYCTDDAGRLLALTVSLSQDPAARRLSRVAIGFLERAHLGGSQFRLRQTYGGAWADDAPSDDSIGRAIFGLATAAAWAPWPDIRRRALDLFAQSAAFRSAHPRATAYAALGAVQLLRSDPTNGGARRLVNEAADQLPRAEAGDAWPWPEPRLSYANALLPDAALSVAIATGSRRRMNDALGLLSWLVDQETIEHHFSFTPVGGRAQGESKPAFDQQPIEAWAMTSACANAFDATNDPRWSKAGWAAGSWFLGNNDARLAVYNPLTGGGYDGLEPHGVNLNEGAESSMAFVATMHQMSKLPLGSGEAFGCVAMSS